MAVRQVPQLPARQPQLITIPLASANSSSDPNRPFHLRALLDLAKVTVSTAAAGVAGAGVGACLTLSAPKASKCTWESGTPQSFKPRVKSFIMPGGPQR